jgi:Ca2+-transporting ATPase
VSYVKGAPEIVLGLCTTMSGADGTATPLDDSARAALATLIEEAAGDAMRVLAFAHRVLPKDMPDDEDGLHERRDDMEKELQFDGLVAIADPVRDDVNAALDGTRAAGIKVTMITGDNELTARSIAKQTGLLADPDSVILTSARFNDMTDAQLLEVLPKTRVIARAKPLDKLRAVKLYQQLGEVVAVTGDGTNDAPALKRADVGLAMGSGTEVAKEASKIVLVDDAFSTIVRAVAWGRTLYANIQRFLIFQLSINAAALVVAFLGPLIAKFTGGPETPLTAVQLLWINVIMDTLAAIALCSEPPRPGLMSRPPRARGSKIVTKSMVSRIFGTAFFYVVVMLGALFYFGADWNDSEAGKQIGTTFFTGFVLFQVWNLLNCRALDPGETPFAGLSQNRTLFVVAAVIVGVQALLVSFAGEFMGTVPLPLATWGWLALGTASVLVWGELLRLMRGKPQATPAPAV